MGKYLRRFESHSQYEAGDFVRPNISVCINEDEVHYNPRIWSEELDHFSEQYLTIVSRESENTIKWNSTNESLLKTISISTDNGQTWVQKTSSTSGTTLAVLDKNDKLLIKGTNSVYADANYYNHFSSTKQFDVMGNIMSLLHGDSFSDKTSLSTTYVLKGIFYSCTNLIDSYYLIFPPSTMNGCFISMFEGCTSLIRAPKLPSMIIKNNCYGFMFQNCKSLKTAPELPATTLDNYCYYCMFWGCTNLISTPVLSAATLKAYCYSNMFRNCTKVSLIKCLATDISTVNCTTGWVTGVASSGTFIKASNISAWTTGVNGIPSGWTTQTAAS